MLAATLRVHPAEPQPDAAPTRRSRLLDTPIGAMRATAANGRLIRLVFMDDAPPAEAPHDTDTVLDQIERELADYFRESGGTGVSPVFSTPIAPAGTPFQTAVWGELLRIPAGATRSYAAIARALGKPGAVRAVGRANGANPIAIVIPCHRVVRSDGSLCGYGGGRWRKQWLLRHEHAHALFANAANA